MACGCEHSGVETCSQCEFEPFVRNNYFTGKLMTAADFIDEQTYHREKQRHHNARLHGSGVVCGLRVHEHPSADCRKRYVIVEPGSAIDCCGHEILVPDAETVDVAQHPAVLEKTNDGALHTLQVVACYRECPTEEVPVLYDDCGCDDTQCAAEPDPGVLRVRHPCRPTADGRAWRRRRARSIRHLERARRDRLDPGKRRRQGCDRRSRPRDDVDRRRATRLHPRRHPP